MKPEQKTILRNTFGSYCEKVALMAAAGLIFGQFVPNTKIDWRIVLSGMIISLGLITLAGFFKHNKKQSDIVQF